MDYRDTFSMRKKGIWKRTFIKLKAGRFISQFGISNPRKLKVPRFLLGHKHSMSESKRQKILEEHKQTKYTKPFYAKLPAPAEQYVSQEIDNNV